MLRRQSIAPEPLLSESCAKQDSGFIPARVDKRNLIDKLSGYPKRTHWMLPVLALSQVWRPGMCKHFVSKRQGADLTNGPGSTAKVSPAVIGHALKPFTGSGRVIWSE